ncbi:MAG: CehA/McbA family metallohydrolase [Candidatus Bathyarchaeota archaeon]|nr:CehA/McbA family metallohydrolase [Candidatus Bathyarchaeota archaeon]
MRIKADLHVHTTYSKDSVITPKELVYYAKQKGLNAVAVTDHNYLEGAYEIAKKTDFLIIPGVEVSSSDGHIVALNVKELIPRGFSAAETVELIHRAGGVAIACHPHVYFKGCLRDKVCSSFDAIEVINARAFPFNNSVKKAEETAQRLGLSKVAGTDADYGPQIGYAYTIIETLEPTVEAIAKAIVEGKCQAFGQAIPAIVNIKDQYTRLKYRLKK